MIKSQMRQALRESLTGMKKGLRDKRAKSYVKDEEEPGETDPDEEDPEHEAKESKKEAIEEGDSPEDWRTDQKNFMKNKSKPSTAKTAIIIAVPGGGKKFGKANFKKG